MAINQVLVDHLQGAKINIDIQSLCTLIDMAGRCPLYPESKAWLAGIDRAVSAEINRMILAQQEAQEPQTVPQEELAKIPGGIEVMEEPSKNGYDAKTIVKK